MCTRFSRVDNGKIQWLEFDLPDVKDVWNEFNTETDRHRYFTQSIFKKEWIDTIKSFSTEPVMFTAEGLLMYFSKDEVSYLLKTLSEHFQESEFVAEIYSKIALKRPHPDVKKTSAERFKSPWGCILAKTLKSGELALPILQIIT